MPDYCSCNNGDNMRLSFQRSSYDMKNGVHFFVLAGVINQPSLSVFTHWCTVCYKHWIIKSLQQLTFPGTQIHSSPLMWFGSAPLGHLKRGQRPEYGLLTSSRHRRWGKAEVVRKLDFDSFIMKMYHFTVRKLWILILFSSTEKKKKVSPPQNHDSVFIP